MSRQVSIWDKISPINGYAAEQVLNMESWMRNKDVIIFSETNGIITNLEDPDIISNILIKENKITFEELSNKSNLEIGQLYLDYLEEQNNKQQSEMKSIEDLSNENAELRKRLDNQEAAILALL